MRTRRWQRISLIALLLVLRAGPTPACARDLEAEGRAFLAWFWQGYRQEKIPGFDMSAATNFRRIPPPADLERRVAFLREARRRMAAVDRNGLDDETRYKLDGVAWALDFQSQRADLELTWRRRAGGGAATGLDALPDRTAWYHLYLQAMGLRVRDPAALRAAGEGGLARALEEIQRIQKTLGYGGRDADFARWLHGAEHRMTAAAAVRAAFQSLHGRIEDRLPALFEPVAVPPPAIKRWTGGTDLAPAYYDRGTFYFSMRGGSFPRCDLDFIYLHEAIPGHHYQARVARHYDPSPIGAVYWCSAYVEGWGAYAEDLGTDLGCYRDPCQALGRWMWDLSRCARVILDVRIHEDGWSRAQALAWWHTHVPLLDDIAEREVDRVIAWPAQSQSYKAGEHEILALREEVEGRLGRAFDVRKFHTEVLRRGPVPLTVLDEIVYDALTRGRLSRSPSAAALSTAETREPPKRGTNFAWNGTLAGLAARPTSTSCAMASRPRSRLSVAGWSAASRRMRRDGWRMWCSAATTSKATCTTGRISGRPSAATPTGSRAAASRSMAGPAGSP
jgi:hypothetical protein